MNRFQPSGALLALTAAFTLPAGAATISTTGSFSEVDHLTSYADPGESSSFYYSQGSGVVGLQQFDPALGTLTGVTLTANFNVQVTGVIEAGTSIVTELDHSASFYVTDGTEPGVLTYVAFSEGGSTLPLAFVRTNISPACTGNEAIDGGPCSGDDEHVFSYGNEMAIIGDTLDRIGLTNLVGTGALTGLTVESFHPLGSVFSTDNVESDETFGDIETLISAGTVTLTYEYSAVPIPAAFWLLGSGLLGLIGVARRKG